MVFLFDNLSQSGLNNNNQLNPASSLVVGYYLCDDPVPYRTVWSVPVSESLPPSLETETNLSKFIQPSLTLGQFKQLIAKKGDYR